MELTFATLEMDDNLSLLFPHKKMGILGGTFNPIHNGHVEMALKVRAEFALEKVLLLPAGAPPHKQEEDELAPGQKRLHMAALCAFEHAFELEACDMEIKREGPSYTVDTMRELTEKNKETDYYFIIGSDSLFEMEGWKDFSDLCRMTQFVCVKREEHDRISIAAEIARLAERYDALISFSEYNGLYVSSSYIRKRVAEGKSISQFVPAPVEEYIYASGLYK